MIIAFTPNLGFSPNSEVIHGRTTLKLTKSLKSLKKNDSYSIWCFWFSFHFLHCNVPDKCYKQKWEVLFFTCIKLVACVLVCASTIAHIKWKRLWKMQVCLSLHDVLVPPIMKRIIIFTFMATLSALLETTKSKIKKLVTHYFLITFSFTFYLHYMTCTITYIITITGFPY